MLGSGIAENFDGAVESIKEGWADLSGWFTDAVWTPISDAAITGINVIVGIAALGWELIKPPWEKASGWFDSTVWQPISNTAEWAWSGVTAMASEAWDGICTFFSPLAAWFDSVVWQPICSSVETVRTTITSAFDEALSFVKGIWNGVASWFEANVINPIKEKFQGLIDLKNKIADAGSAVTGLTTSNGTGHNAIGTSYWGGGWTEVNEHGGEIIDLPQGSRVYPHATTMKMLKDGMGGGTSASTAAPQVTVTGNTFTVREEADIDRIAYRLYQLMFKSHVNMNGGTLA